MFCLLKVNASAWAEEAVRSCGASDAEIKLHHDLSFGIFMDENAPVVIKEALSSMDRTIKKVDEEDESGGGGGGGAVDLLSSILG